MAIRYLYSLIWKKKGEIILVAFVTLMLGELWLRNPFIVQRLEYTPDKDFGAIIKPEQTGFMWLGEMSIKSPPITVNKDGYRGKEIDWNKTLIFVLGASETFGSSVSDNDVWTAKFEHKINQIYDIGDFAVVNAGHPGHGPTHQLVRIKKLLERKVPSLIIVRIGIGMRVFHVPENEEKRVLEYEEAIFRRKVRNISKFIPFLYNKASIQIPRIKQSMKPFFFRNKENEISGKDVKISEKFWEENKRYWVEMINTAKSNNIPIVFWISDFTGMQSSYMLFEYLTRLEKEYSNVYALFLGPGIIDLEGVEHKYANQIVTQKYTLRLDLHGNALQHEILAEEHVKFIINRNILTPREAVHPTKPCVVLSTK